MPWRLSLCVLIVTLGNCDVPRDPDRTLDKILERGEIRAGVTECPPFIRKASPSDNAPAEGIEADLIRALARRHNLRVRWIWGNLEQHYAALEEFKIDLVAGGITDTTPWKDRIGASRPYYESPSGQKHILAVPPGENRWLVTVDRHLRSSKGAVAERLRGAGR